MHVEDTIVATASAHQSGGLRGIVRLSGPHALSAVMRCFQPADDTTDVAQISAPTRIQGVFHVREPIGAVDCALHLWPTERSYTRQPTAEFHTWGPIPLLNAIVETLCGLGARLARPGEFTLRAFLAGRMDLAQAEAVLGVIDSVDDRELSVALQQLAGGLSEPLDQL